jgi:hypothetical protein
MYNTLDVNNYKFLIYSLSVETLLSQLAHIKGANSLVLYNKVVNITLVAQLTQLQHLQVYMDYPERGIKNLTKLRTLIINGGKFCNNLFITETLPHFKQLKHLTLKVEYTPIITILCSPLPLLLTLEITNCMLHTDLLKDNVNSLTSLRLNTSTVDFFTLSYIQTMTNLTTLSLDVDTQITTLPKSLTSLHLYCEREMDLSFMSSLINLTSLDLSCDEVLNLDILTTLPLTTLKYIGEIPFSKPFLSVTDLTLTTSIEAILSMSLNLFPNVTSLYLEMSIEMKTKNKIITTLAKLKNLTSLRINTNLSLDNIMALIVTSAKLQSLYIYSSYSYKQGRVVCNLDSVLQNLTQLKKLTLYTNDSTIDITEICKLSTLTSLRELNLPLSSTDKEVINHFLKIPYININPV